MATIKLGAENFESTITENDTFSSTSGRPGPALAAAAQITSIPTLMAFKDGSLVFSQPGALPAAALEHVITAVRELDIEQIRPDNDHPRSA